MKLHHFFSLAAVAFASFAMVACGEKSPNYGDPAVSANPSTLDFEAAGGTQTVQLKATVDWAIDGLSAIPAWISVTPKEGVAASENQVVTFTVTKSTVEERTYTVTFKQKDGTLKSTVKVNQAAYYPAVEPTTIASLLTSTGYKYSRYELTGVVKNLSSDGSFDLVDETGKILVAGLNASEAAYGQEGGKLDNVKERDTITIVGYVVEVDGKNVIKYATLSTVDPYTEPSDDSVETVSFPFSANFSKGTEKFIVVNKAFPFAFDALWKNTAAESWVANAFNSLRGYDTESWLVSPMIEIKSAKAPILVFSHSVQFFESIETAKEQTTLWMRKKGEEWKQISILFSYPDDLSSEVMISENINLASYIGSTIQFAFKYVSAEDLEAGKWQILKFDVKEDEEPAQGDDTSGTEDYDKPIWDWNK